MISWKRWLLAALAVAVLAACVAATALLQHKEEKEYLIVTLEGERVQNLPVGETYTELGATALYYCGDAEPVAVEVTVTGAVDSSKLGSYLVTYTARWEDCVGTAYRQVKVVDEIPPEITLVENPDSYTLPGHTYVEEGFSASDNYDGDLTEKVVRKDCVDHIIYTVKDSSRNVTTVTRTVKFDDPIPPELKLKGNSKITLTAGTTFGDPGWEATDNCDGDLTEKVTVSGSVNVNVPGTYLLTYTVKDAYDNEAKATRTVVVQARPQPQPNPNPPANPVVPNPGTVIPLPEVVYPQSDRVIYLTFDDGPSQYTPKLLDVLKKYNVKATFFVVNTRYIGLAKRIVEEGHTIAIHTATHKYDQIYRSEDAYFADLYRMQDIIRNQTGLTATILRFPGGSSNSVSKRYNRGIMTRLTQQVEERGFRYFDWNVPSGDTDGIKTAQGVYERVISRVQKHKYSVVLQHDIKGYSVDAVESIIIWGLNNGYTFLPLAMDSPVCEHTPTN